MRNNENVTLARQAEVDIGYDYSFERRWGRFERYIWLFFVLLLVAGLLGFFGRGPLNKVTKVFPDGSTIQFERVVRFKTPTAVLLSVPVNKGTAQLDVDKIAVQKLGLELILPQPTHSLGSGQFGPLEFQVANAALKSVFIQLSMQPASLGEVTSTYNVNGHTPLRITQIVLP